MSPQLPNIPNTCSNCGHKFKLNTEEVPDEVYRILRGTIDSENNFHYTETYGEYCEPCVSRINDP